MPDLQGVISQVPEPRSQAALTRALEASGYTVHDYSRTFFGRIKIVLGTGDYYREIVVSKTTGEIRNDVLLKGFDAAGKGAKDKGAGKKGSGKKSGNSGNNGNRGSGGNSGGNGGGNSGGNGNGGNGGS
ncbi:MAG: hypothetical protein HKN02_13670 [Rhodobacteraceae bacterium]|nr:hypothetical protein [Paracoccaceae bacterium]